MVSSSSKGYDGVGRKCVMHVCVYVILLQKCSANFLFSQFFILQRSCTRFKKNNIQFITQFGPVGFIKKGTDI